MMVREKMAGVMVVAAVLLAGCGVTLSDEGTRVDVPDVTTPSGGSDGPSVPDPTGPSVPDTTGPIEADPTPTTDGTGFGGDGPDIGLGEPDIDDLAETYEELGLEPEDARCLAEAIAESYDEMDSPADFLDILEGCGLSTGDLADLEPGG